MNPLDEEYTQIGVGVTKDGLVVITGQGETSTGPADFVLAMDADEAAALAASILKSSAHARVLAKAASPEIDPKDLS